MVPSYNELVNSHLPLALIDSCDVGWGPVDEKNSRQLCHEFISRLPHHPASRIPRSDSSTCASMPLPLHSAVGCVPPFPLNADPFTLQPASLVKHNLNHAMSAISLLILGLVIVIGGIVLLRGHAFVVLTVAALIVGVRTSREMIYRDAIRPAAFTVLDVDEPQKTVRVRSPGKTRSAAGTYLALRSAEDAMQIIGSIELRPVDENVPDLLTWTNAQLSVLLQPGDQLVVEAAERSARAAAEETVGERVAAGFGSTCRKIGILIAMAAIVGVCLLESGAARRIVDATQQLVGERRTPLAFVISGFVLGIPVFFDTVFFLLVPLARALYAQTGKHYVLYIMSVVVGASMAHSLVPPTPGPLLVASELGIDLSVAILAGILVGSVAALSGFAVAHWLDHRVQPQLADWRAEDADSIVAEATGRVPPVWLSLLPIVVPVLLLAAGTMSDMGIASGASAAAQQFRSASEVLGNKNVALTLAAAVAIGTLWWSKHGDRNATTAAVQRALATGGTVLLITAAGGAFGQVIRQTNIAGEVVRWIPQQGTGVTVLLIGFFITALVRVAQGSATVAMITAVSILAPVVGAMELPFHTVYVMLAIGCGSKPLPWMNDSGFWVVGRMSGFTPTETLKTVSVTLTVMGFVGLLVTICGALVMPFR